MRRDTWNCPRYFNPRLFQNVSLESYAEPQQILSWAFMNSGKYPYCTHKLGGLLWHNGKIHLKLRSSAMRSLVSHASRPRSRLRSRFFISDHLMCIPSQTPTSNYSRLLLIKPSRKEFTHQAKAIPLNVMPPKENQVGRRADRLEAVRRGAETRRRNAAARMHQQQSRSIIIIDDDGDNEKTSKTNIKSSAKSKWHSQRLESRRQTQSQTLGKVAWQVALENKAIIAPSVAEMIFMYLLSGPKDETRIILKMIEAQRVMLNTLDRGASGPSGVAMSVKNAAQVVGAGAGMHLLGLLWRPLVRMALQWCFGDC